MHLASHTIFGRDSTGRVLHRVTLQPLSDLDNHDRRRLGAVLLRSVSTVLDDDVTISCSCGFTDITAHDVAVATAIDHLTRDTALPVHRVGACSVTGARGRHTDSHHSVVDDTTGAAAFAVAAGPSPWPAAATAAAATQAAITAEPTAETTPAVAALLHTADPLTAHPRVDQGTGIVLAVNHPTEHNSTTWTLAWVGGCRAYHHHHGRLTRLTLDDPHVVTAAHPHTASDTIARATVAIPGRLLLVSAGIGPALESTAARALLRRRAPEDCARALAEHAGALPHADNATVLVIDPVPAAPRHR